MVDPMVIAAGISGVSNLVGNLVGNSGSVQGGNMRNMREANHAAIMGKISAAKKAGISPLYALGAPTVSPTVEVGSSGLGETISDMGADVSRAVAAGQTSAERKLQELTLLKAQKDIEFLEAQTASINARTVRESAPPFPGALSQKVGDPMFTTGVNIGSIFPPWESNPNFSDTGQYGENRYGEGLGILAGIPAAIGDMYWNSTIRKALNDVGNSNPSAARQIYDYFMK